MPFLYSLGEVLDKQMDQTSAHVEFYFFISYEALGAVFTHHRPGAASSPCRIAMFHSLDPLLHIFNLMNDANIGPPKGHPARDAWDATSTESLHA